jgi:LmbE family N-acetylglucosaminyl deacetylase
MENAAMVMRDASGLGTILSVWAHPDDESYCAAGLMAMAVRNGQRVVCVTATRGELGSTDAERWPPGPALAEVRTAELGACLAEIGVTEHIWLDYPDGGCADADAVAAAARLRDILEAVDPDTVLTFGPDGATYHPDHIAVSRWVAAATEGSRAVVHHNTMTRRWQDAVFAKVGREAVMMGDGPPVSHEVDECSIYVSLTGELLELKTRAMLCQESQIGPMLTAFDPEGFRGLLAEEAYTLARPQ